MVDGGVTPFQRLGTLHISRFWQAMGASELIFYREKLELIEHRGNLSEHIRNTGSDLLNVDESLILSIEKDRFLIETFYERMFFKCSQTVSIIKLIYLRMLELVFFIVTALTINASSFIYFSKFPFPFLRTLS